MSPQATVILPTHDHGPTLLRSLPTALRQTVEDIEVFVVGDGVPDETREIVIEFAREDDRIRFFDNPKGPNRGEVHRHAALQHARGTIVCYLTDDDLWLPDHVETMGNLLVNADFAHALGIRAEPDGTLAGWIGDLARPFYRRLVFANLNFIPLPCGAHTLDMYRRLPHGWRTTPPPGWTDIYMWQQFLSHPECRVISGTRPTVVYFDQRGDWSREARLAELDRWVAQLASPRGREQLERDVLRALVQDRAHLAETWLEAVPESSPGLIDVTYQFFDSDLILRNERERRIKLAGNTQVDPFPKRVRNLVKRVPVVGPLARRLVRARRARQTPRS